MFHGAIEDNGYMPLHAKNNAPATYKSALATNESTELLKNCALSPDRLYTYARTSSKNHVHMHTELNRAMLSQQKKTT